MMMKLQIQGMHCGSCKALIEDVCKEIPGVVSAIVDVEGKTATIEHDASVSPETIRHAIEALGDYHVALV